MNDMNRRILITGSKGCIGNHAVDFLLAEKAGLVFGFNRSMPENINEKKFDFLLKLFDKAEIINVNDF